MKEIPLTNSPLTAIVDDKYFDYLNQWNWQLTDDGHVARTESGGSRTAKRKTYLMHRVINKTPDALFTDHRNTIGRDNRKKNLRNATKSQNGQHQRPRSGPKSSAYKGVCWDKQMRKWRATIKFEGRSVFIGLFTNERSAASAYDFLARILFGEFALLNQV